MFRILRFRWQIFLPGVITTLIERLNFFCLIVIIYYYNRRWSGMSGEFRSRYFINCHFKDSIFLFIGVGRRLENCHSSSRFLNIYNFCPIPRSNMIFFSPSIYGLDLLLLHKTAPILLKKKKGGEREKRNKCKTSSVRELTILKRKLKRKLLEKDHFLRVSLPSNFYS